MAFDSPFKRLKKFNFVHFEFFPIVEQIILAYLGHFISILIHIIFVLNPKFSEQFQRKRTISTPFPRLVLFFSFQTDPIENKYQYSFKYVVHDNRVQFEFLFVFRFMEVWKLFETMYKSIFFFFFMQFIGTKIDHFQFGRWEKVRKGMLWTEWVKISVMHCKIRSRWLYYFFFACQPKKHLSET